MTKPSMKLFLAGVVVGAIVAPITMFSAGWIVTSGAASAAAKESAQVALVDSLAPICVSQFTTAAGNGDQLEKLKSLSRWNRPEFVSENGWATMPGSNSANSLVASECARRLAAMEN